MGISELPRALLSAAPPVYNPSTSRPSRPSIAVIASILFIMFTLTVFLLLYAKHCRRQDSAGDALRFPSSSSGARNSGLDPSVVESLPVFRFGSLQGQKEGLECAVCLARFQAAEALRLLPKCRHAFHVECIDTWLDAHSSCPLCRARVDPEDVLLLPFPIPIPFPPEPKGGGEVANPTATATATGRRMSARHSSAGERSSKSLIRIVVDAARSRKSVDGAALREARAVEGVVGLERGRKDGLLPTETTVAAGGTGEGLNQRFSHQIVVSDLGVGDDGTRERWSDLRPSDLLFLRCEMISTSSGRCSTSQAGGGGSGRAVISARSLSEIAGVGRFPRRLGVAGRREAEERAMQRWPTLVGT